MRSIVPVTVAVVLGMTFVACAPERIPFQDGGGDAGGTGSDGTASDSRADTNVTPRDTGGFVLDEDAACARQTSNTQRAPMNLLIVLDRSGSMADSGKWTAAVAGVNALITALSDDTRVGLTLFPSRSSADSASGYTTPIVPVGALATTRAMIASAMANNGPTGGTPMACAYLGTRSYFDTFMQDGSLNTVLITDGEPSDECSGMTCSIFPPDINCLMQASQQSQLRIQATISQLSNRTPTIKTFVCGTQDANDSFLSTLAINGRTPRAPNCQTNNTCHYKLGTATFQQDLNMALDEIRGRAATCEYRITVDPTMVELRLINVLYTESTGAAPVLIPRDVTHQNGWDFSGDMRAVLLYGSFCDSVLTNTSNGQIKILYGCPTVAPG